LLLSRYDAYVSALVVQEAGQGDPAASTARRQALRHIPALDVTDAVKELARKLIAKHAIPASHVEDALHVAVAAINGMDFLLTWNFSHLNNASKRSKIREAIEAAGCECPESCSPEELLEDLK
jgi:predicted nucleic acid-binding protein